MTETTPAAKATTEILKAQVPYPLTDFSSLEPVTKPSPDLERHFSD
jgi:hypothetical protein